MCIALGSAQTNPEQHRQGRDPPLPPSDNHHHAPFTMSPTRQPPLAAVLLLAIALSCFLSAVLADDDKVYIKGTGIDGVSRDLEVSRFPSLYTGDFDDCLGGGSLFNVTKFDAAYYADNSTVLFHLDGTSNIRKESLIRRSMHPPPSLAMSSLPLSPSQSTFPSKPTARTAST